MVFLRPLLGLIPLHFTHLFTELQPVCSALHSTDIVRHISFSAMCDNSMRLLWKSVLKLLYLSFEVKNVGANTRRFYSLIFWITAGVQRIALYWHRSTRQLQCNVWQFNEAVGKINAKSIRQMSWVLQKKIGKRVSDRDNENINFDNFKENTY